MKEGETLDELEQKIHYIEWEAIVEGTNIAIQRLKHQQPLLESAPLCNESPTK